MGQAGGGGGAPTAPLLYLVIHWPARPWGGLKSLLQSCTEKVSRGWLGVGASRGGGTGVACECTAPDPQPGSPGPKLDFLTQAEGGAGLAQALPLGSVKCVKHAAGPRKHV